MTTHERAVEVDTELARLWTEAADLRRTLGWKLDALHEAMGDRQERDPRDRFRRLPWADSPTRTVERAVALSHDAPARYPDQYDPETWKAIATQKALSEYLLAQSLIEANLQAARPLEAEYEANRWPRFFLVQNSGGHIHSSMRCATTFPTTVWGWLPHLSGLTEDEAVMDQGPRLCSVCYPSAPVEWTLGLPKAPRCPGSGQKGTRHGRGRYGTCGACGGTFAMSMNTGLIRAHKPKGAA